MKTRFPHFCWRALLFLTWLCGGLELRGQTFTNGGFETVVGPPLAANSTQTLNPGDTWLPGWSAGGPDGAVVIQNGLDGFQLGQDIYGLEPWQGQQWAIFPNDTFGGTLAQTFQTAVGSYCTVTFYSSYVYSAADPLLGVAMTDANQAILTNDICELSYREWTSNQLTFIATTSATTLTCSDASSEADGADIGIDAVSLVAEPPGWPYIITQPLNQTNAAGTAATFVSSAGGNPASVQWYWGSNAISGATNATLTVMADQTNAGIYTAVFSNSIGTNITQPATLIVLQVVASPVNQTADAGGVVTFSAAANLAGAQVQWFFNSNQMSGQTGSTVAVVANGQTAGVYAAQFTYGNVTVTTAPAILTVTNISFVNGSFESVKGGAIASGGDEVGSPGDQWLIGWDFDGANDEVFIFNGPFEGLDAEDGSQWVVFDSENAPPGGAVSQSFSTTVGDTYQMIFWTVAIYDDGNPLKSLLATAQTPTGGIVASNYVVPGTAWSSNQITFVAQTVETTLVFTDTSAPNIGPSVGLDHVSVQDLSITNAPQPVSNLLTAAGLPPGGNSFLMRLNGTAGKTYVIETSTNLRSWTPVSTNLANQTTVNITNALVSDAAHQFWQAIPAP